MFQEPMPKRKKPELYKLLLSAGTPPEENYSSDLSMEESEFGPLLETAKNNEKSNKKFNFFVYIKIH